MRVGNVAAPGELTFSLTTLAGAPSVYGALWNNPARHLSFRPSTSGNYSYSSVGSSVGVLTVPASQVAACAAFSQSALTSGNSPVSETSAGACLYIFGVYCDAAVAGSGSCAYVAAAHVDGGALPRLLDGVPVSVSVPANTYEYFTLAVPTGTVSFTVSATVSTGSAQLLVGRRTVTTSANGTQTITMPTLGSRSSFLASSTTIPPSLTWTQVEPPAPAPATAWLANTTSTNAPPVNLYTVGIYAAGGFATELTLRAFWFAGPIILVPNQQLPLARVDAARPVILYAVTIVDPTADLVVSVPFLDSPVGIAMGSRSSVPSCSVVAAGGTNGLSCTGATWVVSPAQGAYSVTLTIPARRPCANALSPSTCVPALDYAAGTYIIAVQALARAAEYGITAYLSNAALTLIAGQPQVVSQSSTDATQARRGARGAQAALQD